ncbi:MAG: hypothetical protein HZB38_13165, partial [Planctomycetes bacterium]|nr:hypothetical protein [Planctomycetota bacterium]
MATHTHQHDHDHEHGHYHPPHDSLPPSSYSDPGAESLNQALRSGFNVLRVLMIALLLAYAASGWFKINPNEQGLIVRFGKLRENAAADSQMPSRNVFGPGSHFSLPDPFDQKIRVSIASETFRDERFCFQIMPDNRGKSLESIMPQVEKLTPGVQGAMFSGDRNLSHAVFTLEYRVTNAEKFVRNVGEDVREDAQRLLRHFADDAVTRVAAGLQVERLLRQGKTDQADFALDVRRQINEMLAQFDAGLEVNKVTPDTIEPGMVRQAFLGVTRVQNEAKQAEAEARAERE